MRKLSRREMAQLTAGAALARTLGVKAQAPDSSEYIGPLTGVTHGLEDRRFDPVAFTHELYAAAPRRLRFQARTRGDAERWQQTLRAKVIELVGGFPSERPALRPIVLEKRKF